MAKDRPQIVIQCPACGAEKSGFFDTNKMPAGTMTIESRCPECVVGGYGSEAYFDEYGRELFSA